MKIAVVGAGAMGSMLGAYLQLGGADVSLVVRRKELAEKLSAGLTMKQYTDGAANAVTVPMNAYVGADGIGVVDAVLIMVKGPNTKDALATAAPLIGNKTKVITLQNGIGNVDIIAETIPKENIFYGCVNLSAIMEKAGELTCGLFGECNLYLGSVVKKGAQEKFGEELCAIFEKGGISARYTEDIDREVWNKLLVNIAVNAGCGLVRLRGGEAGNDQQFVLLAVDMVKEAIAVAKACGIDLDFGYFMGQILPTARKTSGKHYPSMAQDMMITKVKTEIDFINGAIERLGAQYGIPTPVNTTVARLVRVIENNYDKQYTAPASKGAARKAFSVTVSEKFCKGCGFCVKYCARKVLSLSEAVNKKGYHTAAVVSPDQCVGCLNCTAVCPEAAITIEKEEG